jgi:hypothetical protein
MSRSSANDFACLQSTADPVSRRTHRTARGRAPRLPCAISREDGTGCRRRRYSPVGSNSRCCMPYQGRPDGSSFQRSARPARISSRHGIPADRPLRPGGGTSPPNCRYFRAGTTFLCYSKRPPEACSHRHTALVPENILPAVPRPATLRAGTARRRHRVPTFSALRNPLCSKRASTNWETQSPEPPARPHEIAVAAKVRKVPMPVRALCPISIGVRARSAEGRADERGPGMSLSTTRPTSGRGQFQTFH